MFILEKIHAWFKNLFRDEVEKYISEAIDHEDRMNRLERIEKYRGDMNKVLSHF